MTAIDHDDIDHLAGEYVLGTLPAAMRREIEERLAHDAPLRAAVQAWEARLLPLTAMAPPADVPADLWLGIEQRLDAVQQRVPEKEKISQPVASARVSPAASSPSDERAGVRLAARTPSAGGWWNSLALWRGLSAAGFAAALLAVLLPQALPPEVAPRYVVVLVAPGTPTPGWVVQASSRDDLRLVPLAPTSVPQARALQFWTKADSWAGPVSLGLVKPGEAARVPLDKLPPLQPNQLFEITLEPENGSPIGRPTGPILYIGRAVRLTS